jgi:deoxyribodipyrimidine photo-lyase
MSTAIVVFTRDLRVADNPALAAAASWGEVVPLFVLDDAILRRHRINASRLAFLLDSLRDLDASLRALGGRLVIRQGAWASTVLEVASRTHASQLHLADDVSGYAAARLVRLRALASSSRIEIRTHPGVMVAGPERLRPAGADYYQIFTPYYRQWRVSQRRQPAVTPAKVILPAGLAPGRIPHLAELLEPGQNQPGQGQSVPVARPGGETAGLTRLRAWSAEQLTGYDRGRDDLAADSTSRISAYLHFGCLSPLAVASELADLPGGDAFVRQLAWRDFFSQLLAARPETAHQDYRTRGDRWHDDQDGLAAWQQGQTGYPIVDAAMRQLTGESFMHNRARMIVASFLTKDLYLDWRLGAAHFQSLLADADQACNQLNWQWVAGTGTDRQPGRIFNPTLQSKRFDPAGEYIARYVPELAGLSAEVIHDPPPEIRRSRGYPAAIVDHRDAAARWRAREH